jgi:hypothetical protein
MKPRHLPESPIGIANAALVVAILEMALLIGVKPPQDATHRLS